MKLRNILRYVFPLWIASLGLAEPIQDPFREITVHKLPNGTYVVLSPNRLSKKVSIFIEVGVGFLTETHNQLGISHLVEHMLFRDGKAASGENYYQLMTEQGANVNAITSVRETQYFATADAVKADWILSLFYKMIYKPSFNEKDFISAKKSIDLEMGEPFFLAKWLGFDPISFTLRNWFPLKTSWETEFGIKPPIYTQNEPSTYSLSDISLSHQKLTLKETEAYASEYYHPGNLFLVISGNFEPSHVLRQIDQTFALPPSRKGKAFHAPKLVARQKPWWQSELPKEGRTTFTIKIGLKHAPKDATEHLVIYSYLNFVADRVLKELRIKEGENYAAGVYSEEYLGAQKDFIQYDTSKENLEKNFHFVQQMLDSEARQGTLSDKDVEKAKELYIKQFLLSSDNDAMAMNGWASYYFDLFRRFGNTTSPYQLLSNLSAKQYRNLLKNSFQRENEYISFQMPYQYFQLDFLIIPILVANLIAALWVLLARNRDKQLRLEWKEQLPKIPFHLLDRFAYLLIASFFAFLANLAFLWILQNFFDEFLMPSPAPTLLITFIDGSVLFSFFVICYQFLLGRTLASLAIRGEELLLYMTAIRMIRIPIQDVRKIEIISPFALLFQPSKWIHHRFILSYQDLFLRRGALISFQNGRNIFIGTRDAKGLKGEIEKRLLAVGEIGTIIDFERVTERRSHSG